jgi:hypothetical protein
MEELMNEAGGTQRATVASLDKQFRAALLLFI